jgi:pimeloyl-ACP methyl ester carboxylesterase
MTAADPIIIVPGLMGTRLVDPATRAKIWDPLPSRGRLPAAVVARLADPTPLAPDPTVDNIPILYPYVTAAEAARARTIPGFASVIYEFYGPLAVQLTSPRFRAAARARLGGVPAVHVCGYDWRRRNAVSALRLQAVIERALAASGARRVVLVAHSMGGLVCRWLCRFGLVGGRPAGEAVSALILLASPTHGAPQAYRQLKAGLNTSADPVMSGLLWDAIVTGRDRALIRGFQSVYELLPTAHYCRRNPGWLRFDRAAAGFADASNVDRLYTSPVTGFTAPGATSMAARLAQRSAFHGRLGLFMPSPTFVLYSPGLPTESAYELTARELHILRPLGAGDATVPAFSGRAEDCRLGLRGARLALPAIEHKAIAVDDRVVDAVARLVLGGARIPTRETEGARAATLVPLAA